MFVNMSSRPLQWDKIIDLKWTICRRKKYMEYVVVLKSLHYCINWACKKRVHICLFHYFQPSCEHIHKCHHVASWNKADIQNVHEKALISLFWSDFYSNVRLCFSIGFIALLSDASNGWADEALYPKYSRMNWHNSQAVATLIICPSETMETYKSDSCKDMELFDTMSSSHSLFYILSIITHIIAKCKNWCQKVRT